MLMRARPSSRSAPAAETPEGGALPSTQSSAALLRFDRGTVVDALAPLAEEVPVALEYNGVSHAVMLATPADLDDFALGFTLSEGIVASRAEFHGMEPRMADDGADGITLAIDVGAAAFARLKARRRTLAGRTGCGLCGTESLHEVRRPLPDLAGRGPVIGAAQIARACAQLNPAQPLQRATGATHGAAWFDADGELHLLREDVGRHNALDKLIGALLRAGTDPDAGFALVTSRASIEMVQKSATAGIALLAAVSAPTAAAVRAAAGCGQTLVGFARGDAFSVYTHPARLSVGIGMERG